jgi:glutathione S-transferase
VQRPSTLGYGCYDDTLGALEKALASGPFILGERFSAADVYVGSQMRWGLMTRSLEPRPTFTAYVERLGERSASKRVMAQAEELVKKVGGPTSPRPSIAEQTA